MSEGISLSRGGRAYIAAVVISGAAVIGYSIFQLVSTPPELYWLILLLLMVMSGPLSIRLPSTNATISVESAPGRGSQFSDAPRTRPVVAPVSGR